jgi:mRNA degradation ribonuclease J1/J2
MRPFAGAAPQGAGDQPLWSPMSSSLIAGAEEAVLVDTLITFGQVDALADWADSHGKRITAILVTHGHSDHWIGLARLLERFPDACGLAAGKVLDRARFEATDEGLKKYWHTCFPVRSRTIRCFPDSSRAAGSNSTVTNSRSSKSARVTLSIPPSCMPRRSTRSSPATWFTTRST